MVEDRKIEIIYSSQIWNNLPYNDQAHTPFITTEKNSIQSFTSPVAIFK
ncbi:MAG: hypothetical protein ACXVNN_11100 [Bacteroidia bacterium]